jgi:hypothetical protein
MSLFDDTEEKLELFKTVDQIKNLFGSGAVMKATSLKPATSQAIPPATPPALKGEG